MKKPIQVILMLLCTGTVDTSLAQTGPGIGLYPTGTEPGFGFRSGRNKRLVVDVRIAKANFYSEPSMASFINEASFAWRIVMLEKVRFHTGLGFRSEWNFPGKHRYGAVIPFGVEAFPFPFQNAGLFFECGLYAAADQDNVWQGGIRTAAGFVFYFPKKEKQAE